MKYIILIQLPMGGWKATEENNTYEPGKGVQLPKPKIGYGQTPIEALKNLLKI